MSPRVGLTVMALTVGLALGTGSAVAAAPTTPASPTAPMPVEIVVNPDSDVLGRQGLLVAPGMTPPPQPIPATAYLVFDMDSGDVLIAQNARAKLLPASTIKTLTLIALGPELPADKVYKASEAAANIEGSRVGLVAGSDYTVKQLFMGLMLSSGNDTALALSELVGGDQKAAALMNAKAAELGATDTLAVNTSGLDAPGQLSSARDLGLIGQAMLDDKDLSVYPNTKLFGFPAAGVTGQQEPRARYEIVNHNKLLGAYPGATGGKTGYTLAARGTFIASVDRDGRRLMCTVMHSEGMEYEHCQRLFDWVYAQPAPARPVTTMATSVQASAPPGTTPSTEPSPTGDSTSDDATPTDGGDIGDEPWLIPAVIGGLAVIVATGLVVRRRRR